MTTESNRQIRGRQSGAGSDAAPKFIEEHVGNCPERQDEQ